MISEEQFQLVLDKNASPELHLDTEIRRICHIIATTEADIEKNPGGDAVLLYPDDPDERPYYQSSRMLLLEDCELDIAHRTAHIMDLEIEAFKISHRAHQDYLGLPYDDEDYEDDDE